MQIRPFYMIMAILLSLAAGTYWLVDSRAQAQRREAALNRMRMLSTELAIVEMGERTRQINYTLARSRSEFDRVSKDSDDLSRRRSDIFRQFYSIENSVKEENGGAIPSWLRDDRGWRALDKAAQR
jgi:hypothetical protein